MFRLHIIWFYSEWINGKRIFGVVFTLIGLYILCIETKTQGSSTETSVKPYRPRLLSHQSNFSPWPLQSRRQNSSTTRNKYTMGSTNAMTVQLSQRAKYTPLSALVFKARPTIKSIISHHRPIWNSLDSARGNKKENQEHFVTKCAELRPG